MPAVVLHHNVRHGDDMTSITFQGDAVVMHGDKVGTGPECCCGGECDLSDWDTFTQPAVVVQTDCDCNAGTHDGTYAYNGASGGDVIGWYGTTTCDWTGLPSDAEFLIEVSQSCLVTVATYQFPFMTLQGSTQASQLTLNQDGAVVGTVQVPLFDLDNVLQCTATIIFG